MVYNCLVVDDERPAIKLIEAYIHKLPNLEVKASCENAMQAITALQQHHIDILLLDIQMPELTGMDLLKTMRERPEVILTTAYREYAVDGFAQDVTDYLVKPFSFERFVQATNKAIDRIQAKEKSPPSLSPSNSRTEFDHFFVKSNGKMEKVRYEDILYLESMREYVCIHTLQKRHVIHQTMNNMEEELPKDQFMRIHRSYLVSLKQVQGVMGNMVLIKDKKITIGASYRKKFFDHLRLL
ncbi:MAG: LytTR family DNA-binding domain-containing protein [Bacteroidota bacterium]